MCSSVYDNFILKRHTESVIESFKKGSSLPLTHLPAEFFYYFAPAKSSLILNLGLEAKLYLTFTIQDVTPLGSFNKGFIQFFEMIIRLHERTPLDALLQVSKHHLHR